MKIEISHCVPFPYANEMDAKKQQKNSENTAKKQQKRIYAVTYRNAKKGVSRQLYMCEHLLGNVLRKESGNL